MLKKLSDRLWTADQPQKFFGVELGARMTVIDLDGNGRLLVHSPIKLTPQLQQQIEAIGKVAYIIAPNKWHHLYAGDFKKSFESASLFCAPGLETKRADLKFDGVISEEQNYGWNPQIAHHLVGGIPFFNEVVLFHPHSKTLVITDLATHICESESLLTRLCFKVIGTYGKFGWSRSEKLLLIKDREAYRVSIEKILQWDFERVIVSHGQIIESGGRQKVAELGH